MNKKPKVLHRTYLFEHMFAQYIWFNYKIPPQYWNILV